MPGTGTGAREAASLGASPDPLRSIDWGSKLAATTIDVYFAPEGAVVAGDVSLGWTAYEIEAALRALNGVADVVNLTFRETSGQAGAEFRLLTRTFDDRIADMNPPGEPNAGVGRFDATGIRQGDQAESGGLAPGSLAYKILVHEFGHGLGLAHPHDDGGTSTIWQGVRAAFGDFGLAQLNQGVHTTMSYNDGWPSGPAGPADVAPRFGLEASMMALDIAALQAKYGANLDNATGDDVYRLPQADGLGATFSCIWDAGGYDVIAAGDARDAVIDLRAASLLGEPGGGGWVSAASGVRSGFTIANGVRIEAAQGGRGDDSLRGDVAANALTAGPGDDLLRGGGGRDALRGGAGDDWLKGGGGADLFQFREGDGRDRVVDFQDGTDQLRIGSGADRFSDLALDETCCDAVLRFADVRVTFEDVPLAAFDSADFLFA